MKITKQELRKIIMEELENEVKSLNENDGYGDDGLAAYLFGDGPEAQRLQSRRDKWNQDAAKDKANADRNAGTKDAKKTSDPKEPDNKDYMQGFLRTRLAILIEMIEKAEAAKEKEYGRSWNPLKGISSVYKGSKARQVLDNLTRMREERNLIDKAFEKIKDGIFDYSAWKEKYGK